MMQRTLGALALFTLALFTLTACARTDAKVGTDRVNLSPRPAFYSSPTLSKQGRLAYATLVDGKSAIFVADGDGKNAKRVSFGTWDFGPIWSNDGKWIAFGRDVNGGDVLVVPADGGAERTVAPTPIAEAPLAWLPGDTSLLFMKVAPTGTETWIYHLGDGSSEKFLKVDGSATGFPSPDGNLIAYTLSKAGTSTVWIWDRARNSHRQLTTEGFESAAGEFSPDGRWLIYGSRRTGTPDLWKVDVSSGERIQLTQDVADDISGRWSPDGKRILFQSTRGGQPDLWVLATGESDIQRVTDDALGEFNADWTPDGTGVVFGAATGFLHIQKFPTDGGPPVTLTSGDWDDRALDVSRDGKQVAFGSTRNGDEDIWVVPVAGGEPRLVSSAPGIDTDPQWSPDGTTIAFRSGRAGNSDIWLVAADGGQARQLTTWPTSESGARWSPDGKTVAFTSNRASIGSDLWTVPAGGGDPVRLTTLGTVSYHRWSPDGKQIAIGARTAASGGNATFVIAATGGTPRMVAKAETRWPQWSPDGREIAVARTSAGYAKIEVYSAAGTLLRTLTESDTVYEGPGEWTADGSRMLIDFQDLYGDGGVKLAIQSANGAERRLLGVPQGFSADFKRFADDGRTVVALVNPVNTSIVRVKAP